MVNISVVLPTFNEKNNILALIKQISNVLGKIKYSFEIIVVDDNSPDGTGYLCKKIKSKKVKVFIRKNEKGFASAIMYGLKKSKGKFIIVMDTDFSHDPKLIPTMLKLMPKYDIVIGSRYVVRGGGENKLRYFLSKLYNIFLHYMVNIDIKDSLFGYFCIRKSFLIKNNLINSEIFYGFGDYFIRLAYYIKKYNGKFLEIPAFYKDRTYGKSKSNLTNMLITYTKTAIDLRLNNI